MESYQQPRRAVNIIYKTFHKLDSAGNSFNLNKYNVSKNHNTLMMMIVAYNVGIGLYISNTYSINYITKY